MAITFKNMQDRINLDYLNRTDFTNETKRAIIRAIKHYERERFHFNQTATAINASTASYTLSLPADFVALDMVSVSVNGVAGTPVVQRTMERVVYRQSDGTSGIPQECAMYAGALQLYPKPSSAFPVTVRYTQTLTELSADADTNDWCSAAEDLIVFHATADMLANVIRGRPDEVAQYRDMEAVALASLQRYRSIRLNSNEDLSAVGPQHRQEPSKTDGGGGGKPA